MLSHKSCAHTHEHTHAVAFTQRNVFCLCVSHSHAHAAAPAIYSHLSHTGKCIHVLRASISLFCLSISHTHSPKQSPSITTSLHFSPSLSFFISPSSTVNHSFPHSPALSPPTLLTYISLLYNPPRLFLSLSVSASHPSPGVFLGDQSSSSHRCHTVGSSQNACAHTHTHTHTMHNEWTTNAKIYI